jgi:hypothetical protein
MSGLFRRGRLSRLFIRVLFFREVPAFFLVTLDDKAIVGDVGNIGGWIREEAVLFLETGNVGERDVIHAVLREHPGIAPPRDVGHVTAACAE